MKTASEGRIASAGRMFPAMGRGRSDAASGLVDGLKPSPKYRGLTGWMFYSCRWLNDVNCLAVPLNWQLG